MANGGRRSEEEGQRYKPSGRGGEGPEEGSIMSSEVTLYLHPLLSDHGNGEEQSEGRRRERKERMDGWISRKREK